MYSHAQRIVPFAALAALLLLSRPAPAEPELNTDKLGKQLESVVFTGLDGQPVPIGSLKDKKAVVVVFLSFECPVSNSYAAPLTELAKHYAERDVALVAVCPTDDGAAQVRKQVAEFKVGFPVYIDPKRTAADAFKATTTPEAFVLDHNFVMRYRGRIDNAWAARLKRNLSVTEHDLTNAIEDLLAGKPVRTPATRPVGCPIGCKADLDKAVTSNVTFHKDVQPILQNHCQGCHRAGEVGPFSLTTYKQAVNWADDIKEYTTAHRMPPWKPVEGPEFLGERKLSDAEIKTLTSWVDGGTPQGDPKDAPPPKQFPEGWQLGTPDLVLQPSDDFYIGPSGPDIFRCFVLPTNLPEDKFIIGYEIRPGNPRVVHHTLNYWDATGTARQLEAEARAKAKETDEDRGPGYSAAMGLGFLPNRDKAPPGVPPIGGFGGWAPGAVYRFLPEECGYYLPKGADIIIQTHYHRDGRPEKDRLQVGLYFAKQPVKKRWQTIVVEGFPKISFPIPAGKADHVRKGSAWLYTDCTIRSVMPHMHLLGKKIKVTMTSPDGETQTLVRIDDWDYNWQETYWFKEPIQVKAGTRFDVEAVYDNSDKNPNNPNHPPKMVLSGEQTTNEMLFGFIGATNDDGRKINYNFGTFGFKKSGLITPDAKKPDAPATPESKK
jgi:peroxiredoxin